MEELGLTHLVTPCDEDDLDGLGNVHDTIQGKLSLPLTLGRGSTARRVTFQFYVIRWFLPGEVIVLCERFIC